jgi:ubiquinone/menaquinone biosynthesis C-methylase UbiE
MNGAHGAGAILFDDGAAYERFMGGWSRAVGARFLDWLAPAAQAHWLEAGSGTGAFTQLVSQRCRPATITAFDPAPEQIAYARRRLRNAKVAFLVASAEAIPFADSSYDVVVSALAMNFMRNREAAVSEMRRVSRTGGTIAGYVWDFAAQRMPNAPLVRAMRCLGIDAPRPPGADACSLDALHRLFTCADLCAVDTTAFEIEVSFSDFAAFWTAQTPCFSPMTRVIASLGGPRQSELEAVLRSELPVRADGSIAYPARAHAVKARVS